MIRIYKNSEPATPPADRVMLYCDVSDSNFKMKRDDGSIVVFGSGGGGGAVDSVNGQTGVVDLTSDDLNYVVPGVKYGYILDGDSLSVALSKLQYSQGWQFHSVNSDVTVPTQTTWLRETTYFAPGVVIDLQGTAILRFI
jgi:hypothetical protein